MISHVFARFMVLAASLQGLKRRNPVLVTILAMDLSLEFQSPQSLLALHQEVKIDQPVVASTSNQQFQSLVAVDSPVATTATPTFQLPALQSHVSAAESPSSWWTVLHYFMALLAFLDALNKISLLLIWCSDQHEAYLTRCFVHALDRRGQWTLLASFFHLSHTQFLHTVVVS